MVAKRQIILLTRHGVKDGDNMVPETVPKLYSNTGGYLQPFIQEYGLTPGEAVLNHSNKIRTKHTGEAILSGAFSLKPVPQRQEDLAPLTEHLVSQGLVIKQEDILGYDDLVINEEALKRDGEAVFMQKWTANPYSGSYDGKPNTSFNDVKRTRTEFLKQHLKEFIPGNRYLSLISTHGGNIDGMLLSLINSARNAPATLEDIGGLIPMEGFGALTLDQKPKSGSYQASLQRNGTSYPVDLTRLLSE